MYARKKRKERHMIRKKCASTVVNECINKGYKHCVCPARCSPDTHGAIFCNSRISSIVSSQVDNNYLYYRLTFPYYHSTSILSLSFLTFYAQLPLHGAASWPFDFFVFWWEDRKITLHVIVMDCIQSSVCSSWNDGI